jgi:hypothetical protein
MIREIYLSTDVETDGPIPGDYSMLSLGCAAYLADKTLLDTFEVNLEALPHAKTDPETMEWWSKQPDAWAACTKDPVPPARAMADYLRWINGLPGEVVFVGYPLAFDFMFVQWYLFHFTGQSPFGHAGVDIRSCAMALLGESFHSLSRKKLPASWSDALPHPHTPLADAIEQGALFCNILREAEKRSGRKQ